MKVVVRDGDVERAIKSLRRKLMKEGVIRDMKRLSHYEKPSDLKRRRQAEAVRRARRTERRRIEADA